MLFTYGNKEEIIMTKRTEFVRSFTNAPWEKQVAYCRVLRAENHIYISGTTAVDANGNVFQPGNAYEQAKRCFEIIQSSLEKLDISLSSVVRTRMFVTDISRWSEFGKAHQEFFAHHPPVTTMVEVKQLINPQMLIEVEAEAYWKTTQP